VRAPDPREIRELFDDISPTYDLLNRLLSLGCDQRWRRRTAELIRAGRGDLVVDLCGGTGDLALALSRSSPASRVVVVDFAQEMLRRGREKLGSASAGPDVLAVAGDACALPLPDQSCAGMAAAFGLRNLRSVRAGLAEARRVLRVGGRLAILEFFRPTGPLAPLRRLAVNVVVPGLASLVAPARLGAYRYLANSITRFFTVDEMVALLQDEGFGDVYVRARPMGLAAILGATRQ